MKKLLVLLVPVLGACFGHSQAQESTQAEATITAPINIAQTSLRAPNGTPDHTTLRGVIIIPASELTEIPASTVITKLGLIAATVGGPGPADGNIQFYLQNTADITNLKPSTWASIIAPMTSVYTGPYVLPAAVGPFGDLSLSSSFTYTGGSLYVAYDYLGATFTQSSWIYGSNNSLAGGWRGLSSATTTPPEDLSSTSAFRPSFRFTFDNLFFADGFE